MTRGKIGRLYKRKVRKMDKIKQKMDKIRGKILRKTKGENKDWAVSMADAAEPLARTNKVLLEEVATVMGPLAQMFSLTTISGIIEENEDIIDEITTALSPLDSLAEIIRKAKDVGLTKESEAISDKLYATFNSLGGIADKAESLGIIGVKNAIRHKMARIVHEDEILWLKETTIRDISDTINSLSDISELADLVEKAEEAGFLRLNQKMKNQVNKILGEK